MVHNTSKRTGAYSFTEVHHGSEGEPQRAAAAEAATQQAAEVEGDALCQNTVHPAQSAVELLRSHLGGEGRGGEGRGGEGRGGEGRGGEGRGGEGRGGEGKGRGGEGRGREGRGRGGEGEDGRGEEGGRGRNGRTGRREEGQKVHVYETGAGKDGRPQYTSMPNSPLTYNVLVQLFYPSCQS